MMPSLLVDSRRVPVFPCGKKIDAKKRSSSPPVHGGSTQNDPDLEYVIISTTRRKQNG